MLTLTNVLPDTKTHFLNHIELGTENNTIIYKSKDKMGKMPPVS